jgi:hypothetical protein
MTLKTIRRFGSLAVVLLWLCCVRSSAQEEGWGPAPPAGIIPTQLSVFNCKNNSGVNAHWAFAHGGYRVTQPPEISRNGQTISVDARVEVFSGGPVTLAIVLFEKNFDLGPLPPGTYTLEFKSWGSILKVLEFTVKDTPDAARPIDDRCFFVAQHYRDFLSRESDGGGFAFWTNELGSCGTDTDCLAVKRVNVSAAFFLSIEFKETAYYVYRLYKGALGRPPTLAEFVPDAAQLGKNVVVNNDTPWFIRLDGNKIEYTGAFFNRSDFHARYDGLTNAEYVDKLFQTEGITPTATERNQLINSLDQCPFNSGCTSRASVLRKIIENPAFDQKVFNEAFVTMEYFGYLRRDPDPDGFQFWLSKLNQFNGDFVKAEMVNAFISSTEYRNRF